MSRRLSLTGGNAGKRSDQLQEEAWEPELTRHRANTRAEVMRKSVSAGSLPGEAQDEQAYASSTHQTLSTGQGMPSPGCRQQSPGQQQQHQQHELQHQQRLSLELQQVAHALSAAHLEQAQHMVPVQHNTQLKYIPSAPLQPPYVAQQPLPQAMEPRMHVSRSLSLSQRAMSQANSMPGQQGELHTQFPQQPQHVQQHDMQQSQPLPQLSRHKQHRPAAVVTQSVTHQPLSYFPGASSPGELSSYRRSKTVDMMAVMLSASRSNAGFSTADSSSDSEAEKEAAETARLINARAPVNHSRNHSWAVAKAMATPSAASRAAASRIEYVRASESDGQEGTSSQGEGDAPPPARSRHSYHLSQGHAAVELFLRLSRARQTLEFAKRQAAVFAALDHCEMDVWEALDMLSELREYEAALLAVAGSSSANGQGNSGSSALAGSQSPEEGSLLNRSLLGSAANIANEVAERAAEMGVAGDPARVDILEQLLTGSLTPDMPLMEHALQCAQLCQIFFGHLPEYDFMPLVGLISGLGKLLAHKEFGSQPQWAICGESFPLGCRFDSHISGAHFFSANPDRRRRLYQTSVGIYSPGCGLKHVFMSWGASEFLHMVLSLNTSSQLPPIALSLLRLQKFTSLTRPGGAYAELLSEDDRQMLPLLRSFQLLCSYQRVDIPSELALPQAELRQLLESLMAKYLPMKLAW